MNELQKTEALIVYLQLKFDEIQNDYLSQTLVFLAEVGMKKKIAAQENWINSFILREHSCKRWRQ